jgi:hypothetical protein
MKTFAYIAGGLAWFALFEMLFPTRWADGSDQDVIDITEAAVWVAQNRFPKPEADQPTSAVQPVEPDEDRRSLPEDAPPRPPVAETTAEVENVVPMTSEDVPMRLTFDQLAASSPSVEKIRCTVHSSALCVPCQRMKRENGGGDHRIEFVYTDSKGPVDSIPCVTYIDAFGKVRYMTGFRTTQQVWDVIQRNDPPVSQSRVASAGPAGSIHAGGKIRESLAWWRQNIGEGVKASAQWDRTGGQTFPLLAKGDWSALALCGRYGHVQLSAKGAVGLPVQSLGFGYGVDGDDIWIDGDKLTFVGLARSLNPNKTTTIQATPSQFGPGTILTIVSVVRGVWSLLHPTCDLQLGGNVSATAVLNGDMLAIDFQQCPSIKLVALFTFQLEVKRLEITEQSVRVVFGGSRFVKERTFKIVDSVAGEKIQDTRHVATASDLHSHTCQKCQITWSHSSASKSSVVEHTCPGCGGVGWDKD